MEFTLADDDIFPKLNFDGRVIVIGPTLIETNASDGGSTIIDAPINRTNVLDAPINEPTVLDAPINKTTVLDASIKKPTGSDAPINEPIVLDAPINKTTVLDASIKRSTGSDAPINAPPIQDVPINDTTVPDTHTHIDALDNTSKCNKVGPTSGCLKLRWAAAITQYLRQTGVKTDFITVDNGERSSVDDSTNGIKASKANNVKVVSSDEGNNFTIVDPTYNVPTIVTSGSHGGCNRVSKGHVLDDGSTVRENVLSAVEGVLSEYQYSTLVLLDFGQGIFTKEMLKKISFLIQNTSAAIKEVTVLTDVDGFLDRQVNGESERKQASVELQYGKRLFRQQGHGLVVYKLTVGSLDVDSLSIEEYLISFTSFALSVRIPFNRLSSAFDPKCRYLGGMSQINSDCVDLVKRCGRVMYSRESVLALKTLMTLTGTTTAVTTGCFDIFHAGHAAMLDEAKTLADFLIVLLNSDTSVKLLKGHARPFCTLDKRLYVLLALKSVDFVVIFDEDKPSWIVDILDPDVLVKGMDYTVDRVRKAFPHVKRYHISEAKFDVHTSCIAEKCKKA